MAGTPTRFWAASLQLAAEFGVIVDRVLAEVLEVVGLGPLLADLAQVQLRLVAGGRRGDEEGVIGARCRAGCPLDGAGRLRNGLALLDDRLPLANDRLPRLDDRLSRPHNHGGCARRTP
ncbi:MAG: hypothetical protein U0794_11430 [Isosphaeraceae bacterium]